MVGAFAGFTMSHGMAPEQNPRIVQDIIALLDRSPKLHLYSTRELAMALNRAEGRLQNFSTLPALADYRHMTPQRRVYWGSKKTIAELKRRLKKLENR